MTVTMMFKAFLNERELLPRLLAAGDDLDAETRATVAKYVAA